MRFRWLGMSTLLGATVLVGCGDQEGPPTEGAEAAAQSSFVADGNNSPEEPASDVSDCGMDYPTVDTLAAAAEDSVVVLHGTFTKDQLDEGVNGIPPGAFLWDVDTISAWQTADANFDLNDISIVGGELVEGKDPCGPLMVEGRLAFVFLSNAASSEASTFYPIAVLTDQSQGVYIDSDGRIPNSKAAEVEKVIHDSGLKLAVE